MSQQLKVGQVWKDREGREVKITQGGHEGGYPFDGDNGEAYTDMGCVWIGGDESSRDLIELIRDVPDSDVPDSDGWITWNGGERPVSGDTVVETRYCEGITDLTEAGNLRWEHHNLSGDILAYRVVKQPAKSEQRATDSEGWITWNGGECPVSGDTVVETRFWDDSTDITEAGNLRWEHSNIFGDILAYRIVEQPAKSEQPAPNPKHAHYFKSVAHLDTVDVYRVCELFGVTDQAIGHAIKKLLCAGQRGVKDQRKDVQEAIDTLTRRVAMWQEDEVAK